jgi:hypothetical protein
MDHRLKACIQWGLSLAPGGTKVNNFLQEIRNTLPASYLENKLAVAREMVSLHAEHAAAPPPPESLRSLEIGAGWDLLLPLAMRGIGCGRLQCIDIYPHLNDSRIDAAVSLLHRIDPEGCGTRLPARVLEERYGIRYTAPCDARATGFDADSYDLFLSYNVLEHIPASDLPGIHAESFRLLGKGAVAIHNIDLQDHWAYANPRRSVHGFLSDGPLSWKFLNPPIHFQNRLRAKEHLRMLVEAGFEIVWKRETAATPEQLESLRRPGALRAEFLEGCTLEEAATTNLVVVARKP